MGFATIAAMAQLERDQISERTAMALAHECDVLFHDAQYTDEELPARAAFGHASTGYASTGKSLKLLPLHVAAGH